MIFDIHSHLLPGVDDGSPCMKDSIQLVRDQIEDGVTEMILTPHYRLNWFHTPKEQVLAVYDEFLSALADEGLEIRSHTGQEAHDDPLMFREVVEGRVLTLAGTEYFLLELDWENHNVKIVDDVKAYVKEGFIPIIVHYERFNYKSMDEVMRLRDAGALFQINTYSLLGVEDPSNRDFALKMLDNDLAEFIATDYHVNKFRETTGAYELIGRRYGEAKRSLLFHDNAQRLFGI